MQWLPWERRLTSQQASLMKRYTEEVLIMYDSDLAGRKAALRAIPLLKAAGLHTKVIDLHPCKDPDEFIKTLGKEEFARRLEKGMNSFLFEARTLEVGLIFDPQGKTDFYTKLARRMASFEDESKDPIISMP